MFMIQVQRGGTVDFSGSLYEADGTTPVVLAATDVVRVKIFDQNEASPVVLDLDDVAATANGSVVTIDGRGTAGTTPATYSVRLAQGDTEALDLPVYAGQVAVVDDSETAPADAYKPVEDFILSVVPGPQGDKGLS